MDISESAPPQTPDARPMPRLGFGMPGRLRRRISEAPDWQRGLVLFFGLIVFVVVYVAVLGGFVGRKTHATGQTPLAYRFVDDAARTGGFSFVGGWERVVGKRDGRSGGTSTRSFRIGASATLPFTGSAVRIYGVTGPNGGTAAVTLDGRSYGTATFYSATEKTGAVVFQSPALADGKHQLSLLVEPPPAGSAARGYVNVDGAAFTPQTADDF